MSCCDPYYATNYRQEPCYDPVVHTYPQPDYISYSPPDPAYDDTTIHDPYYPESRRSASGHPAYDDTMIHDPYYPESRRSASGHPPPVQPTPLVGPPVVKFKRKGASRTGVTVGEVGVNVRLSGSNMYTFRDLGVDGRGNIYVNLRWSGHNPLKYEIPVDQQSGYVDIQSLARRVARAVSHYLQVKAIPIRWDRCEMQYLEEMSPGMWHLKMRSQ